MKRHVAGWIIVLILVPALAVLAAPISYTRTWGNGIESQLTALRNRVSALEAAASSTTTSTTTTSTTSTSTTTTTQPTTTTTQSAGTPWPDSPPGPTGPLTVHNGDFVTTSNGQVVQNLEIRGRFMVKHDNVTLRNSRVLYTTNYGLDNRDNHSGLLVVDVEFNGANLPTTDARAAGLTYSNGWTLRRVWLHNAPQGFLTYGKTTIEDSYLVVDRFTPDGAHREAVYALGADHVFRRNVMVCNVPQGGCSAALAVYGEVLVASNILIENNLFGGTVGYCVYGGGTHEFGDQNTNVRLLNNGFDPSYVAPASVCGRSGNWTALNAGVRGNVASGNYLWPSREPL